MTQNDFLQPALIALANLHVILNEKGGPAYDGRLFEQILSIQDSILQKFGVPVNPDNERLLWFESIPTEKELVLRVNQLHETATEYLLSNAKPELQILQDAQQTKQNPMYVLPELKIRTHTYTIFVYNKILLKQKDSIENILDDLRLANDPDILNALGQIQFGTTDHDPELIEFIEKKGVRYVSQFIIHNSNLLGDDDY